MENKQKIIVKSGLNQLGRATLPTRKEYGTQTRVSVLIRRTETRGLLRRRAKL